MSVKCDTACRRVTSSQPTAASPAIRYGLSFSGYVNCLKVRAALDQSANAIRATKQHQAGQPRTLRAMSQSSLGDRRRTIRAALGWIGVEAVSTQKIEAVGDGGKHGIQTSTDRTRPAREIYEERRPARPRKLT